MQWRSFRLSAGDADNGPPHHHSRLHAAPDSRDLDDFEFDHHRTADHRLASRHDDYH